MSLPKGKRRAEGEIREFMHHGDVRAKVLSRASKYAKVGMLRGCKNPKTGDGPLDAAESQELRSISAISFHITSVS
jgi:hypothetical protein